MAADAKHPPAEPPLGQVAAAAGPLRVCARFLQPMDAEIFASCLATEGITAKVMDSDTLYANGVFAGGVSGVRVMVPESQVAAAERVLADFNAGAYALDENFDPNA